MDPNALPPITLALAVLAIAFFYASVGFGGASGYLAAMSLFVITPQVMSSTALTLNILVSALAFIAFYHAGHLNWRLLWPFLITSIPAAFLGGFLKIDTQVYLILLNLALTYVAVRLLLFEFFAQQPETAQGEFPLAMALVAGLGIGLLSGIIGVGGGIFLAPLIVLTGWGTSKQAAAVAAAFIFLNSISGVAGRIVAGQYVIGWLGLALLPLVFLGGWIGGRFGARKLSGSSVQRLLGVILLLAVARFWLSL